MTPVPCPHRQICIKSEIMTDQKPALTPISEFKSGQQIQGFFLCREKQVRHTRTGDLYINLTLQDHSGSIAAKMWDLVGTYQHRFQSGEPVAVKGSVIEYNGKLQLTVTHINHASVQQYARYGFQPEQLIPTISESREELLRDLLALTETLSVESLRKLVQMLIAEHQECFLTLQGSVSHHHLQMGGYLKHTLQVARLALSVGKLYPELNRDLLLAGAILHDVGKIPGMTKAWQSGYTDEGHLIGHAALGRDMIREAAATIPDFPQDDLLKLEHIILSHQGSPARGTPVAPRFPEAMLISMLDDIDTRLDIMETLINQDKNDRDWTDFRNHFHTQIWKRS